MKQLTSLLFAMCCTISIFAQSSSSSWQQTSGPEGGNVYTLVRNASKVYAGTENGLWVSADEGQTWSVAHPVFYDMSVVAIHISGDEILVLASKPIASYEFTEFLYQSTDGGLTFNNILPQDAQIYVDIFRENKIQQDGNLIWIIANSYLYKVDLSNDTVTKIEPDINIPLYDCAVSGNKVIGHDYDVTTYRSADWGNTWTLETDSSYINTLLSFGDTLIKDQPGLIDSIFVSYDFGINWQGAPSPFYAIDGVFRSTDGTFYTFRENKLRTSPDGLNWTIESDIPGNNYVTSAVESGDAYIMGTYGGIFRSTQNNSQIEGSNSGFIGNSIYSIAALSNGRLITSARNGTWTSMDQGLSWTPLPCYYNNNYEVRFIEMTAVGDTLWALGNNDSLYTYINSTNTWKSVIGADAWFAGETFVRVLGGNLYLVEDAQIRRSTNGGATWVVLPLATLAWNGFRDVTLQDGHLFVSTNDGLIYRSDDDGVTWTQIYEIWSPGAHRINKLGTLGGRLFIWSEYEAYYSDNGGNTWDVLPMSGLPTDTWGYIYFEPVDIGYYGNAIFVTIPYLGVWVSFDLGSSWQPLVPNATHKRMRYIEFSGTKMFVGSSVSGVWSVGLNFEIYGGLVFNDLNQNGQKDTNEPPMKHIVVSAEPLGSFALTDENGRYSLIAATQSDSIKTYIPNNYAVVAPSAHFANQPGNNFDFAVHFIENIIDYKIDLVHWQLFRPGFDNTITLTIENVGTQTSPLVHGVCALPAGVFTVNNIYPSGIATVVNDSIFWQVDALTPSDQLEILLEVTTSTDIVIGDELLLTASVSAENDVYLPNNQITVSTIVVGSFDPNDKSAAERISPIDLAARKPIEYIIRFENTGDFYAEKVVIKDALEKNLKPATIRLISSSHPCSWTLKNDGTLEFTFNNILLQPTEMGFVKFSVEANPALQLNETVSNTAEIYFDFNQPIITNTVKTTVQYPISGTSNVDNQFFSIRMTPNPAHDRAMIEITANTLAATKYMILYDAQGRIVKQFRELSARTPISLDGMSSGMYQVVLVSAQGKNIASGKLVIKQD